MIKRVLFMALFCLVFASNMFAFDEQAEHWISMLGSTNQQDRNVASQKLRTVFFPSSKEEWERRLSLILPGMSLNDVEKELEKVIGFKPR